MTGKPIRTAVRMHVLMFVQGHHNQHYTDFVLTVEGGDPENSRDVISRVMYKVRGVQRDFVNAVAAEMDTELTGPLVVQEMRGWHDHVSYAGTRTTEDN